MKKIEFIAPVEAMRGKLSGNQTLLYAENDNPAFESPKGKRNYARNYRPSFIGAKVSSTGKVYFAVKTKSAVHMTQKAITAMALQGATGALVGALLANKSALPYRTAYAAYLLALEKEQRLTFRKYVSDKVRAALIAKAATIAWTEQEVSVSFKNPWYDGSMTTGAEVSNDVLVKFWTVLTSNGIEFAVDGLKGIAKRNDTFDDLMGSNYNVLGISADGDDNVMLGRLYVTANDEAISVGTEITNGYNYTLSEVLPQP